MNCTNQICGAFQAPNKDMSEHEFDNYLALLGGLLRLGTQQRAEIAGELRDHLEERLADLTCKGVPRDEAIAQALAEFGDAAGMAAAFLDISRNRKRRWIMKWTAYSIGGLAACIILAVALWPERANVKLTPQAVAQAAAAADPEAADPKAGDSKTGNPATPARATHDGKTREDNNAAAEETLSKQISSEFVETPLKDVIEYLKDLTGLEFYVNWKKLESEGVNVDSTITIKLKKVRVDMLLDLALAQAGDGVAYVLRDGIVIVSSAEDLEQATEVRVYNCRDLLKFAPPVELGGLPGRSPASAPGGLGGVEGGTTAQPGGSPSGLGGLGGPRSGSLGGPTPPGASGPPTGAAPGSPGGSGPVGAPTAGMMSGMMGPMGGMGRGGSSDWADSPAARAERLMNILTISVGPDTWQDAGGFGTVAEYSGLLVVNHNARTHRQIEKVLSMLRESIAKDAAANPSPPRGPRTR